MSKPTLGRGLGDLLGSESASNTRSLPRKMDVGLRILIDGAPRDSAVPEGTPTSNTAEPETSQASLTKAIVVVALGSADATLLGWTAHYAITHKHAVEWFGTAGCVLSTIVAAACGCAAVLFSRAGK